MTPPRLPFLLLFRESSPELYRPLSARQRQQLLERWTAWYDGLAALGKVHHGHPLEPEGRIVSGPRGERVAEGNLADSGESIAGYFLLTVTDLDEATRIAQECPTLDYGMRVEVRAISDCCHLAHSLTHHPAAESLSA